MKFPTPEKGVPRYEVRFAEAEPYDGSTLFTRKRDAERMLREEARYWSDPAYIYDRRTGKVIATNEAALRRKGGEE